jgi:hypothetical protein
MEKMALYMQCYAEKYLNRYPDTVGPSTTYFTRKGVMVPIQKNELVSRVQKIRYTVYPVTTGKEI